jgi:hypothetical protein
MKMKKYISIKTIAFAALLFVCNSCFNDLDTIPLDTDITTAATAYDNPDAYIQVLAKLYAGLAVSGQEGPSGQADISGIDEGFGQYLRGLWYHQELPTDEAVIGWNDQTIKDYHDLSWSSEDGFTFAFYSRVFYQIPLCNEYLRETAEDKLNERGVSADLKKDIQGYRAEARFLRALSYWHALDIFRNVPFVTEEDKVGSFFPEQISGPDLFNYIESELKAIENDIAAARTNVYGRADQGAVWSLLAKLYLNAEVYAGTAKYAECLEYCNKVIGAGYTLDPSYENMFLADNHNSPEFIFPITFDGVNTKTWGGTTFILRAGIGGSMDPTASGVSSGWGGTRTTKEFVAKFPQNLGGIVVSPNEGQSANYPKIYFPGDHQGWDAGNTETALASILSDQVYEGYSYFEEDNNRFVITKFPSFSLTYGDNDADGTLEINGDTIIAGEAGLYFLNVDLNDKTYVMEKHNWGVIGDATPTAWDSDTDMVWDAENKAMKITIDLVPGSLKFRVNDDWTYNLGDENADGILSQDGNDIMILEGGKYEILLFVDKPDYTYQLRNTSSDTRGYFYTEGQNLEIDDLTLFTDGYAINKFKNVTSDGAQGSNPDHVDTDFPVFRLADIHLMAAEAIMRSNGDMNIAVQNFNAVRERAYNGTAGNVTADELTFDLLLDERARELYWEGHRRTDLVRFNKFTTADYLWAWKGGVKEGKSVESFRNIFPIPSADLGANPMLEQNTGY